jgi:hypothetical protein
VRTRLYRRYVDAVDFTEIQRIADYQPLPALQKGSDFGVSLGLSMVQIERGRTTGQSRDRAVRMAIVDEALGIKFDDSDQ